MEFTNKEYDGCKHYNRNCSIISPCCNKEFSCRLCHDEFIDENELDYKKKHQINRFDIYENICKKCNHRQKVSNKCEKCNIQFAKYFCNICKLFDNIDKQQYHCDKCNICRIGGKENFFHCEKCSCCLSISIKDNHKCIKDKIKNKCPICMEDMFNSIEKVSIINCGHAIHQDCLKEYIKTNYKCPLCAKSITDMTNYFNMLDLEIENIQLPDEYKDKKVDILCNDCEKKSNVKFHFAGLKCKECNSYNTSQI